MPKFTKGISGNPAGAPKVMLTPVQLAEIKRLASQGKLDSGIAAGLGISLRLYRELKLERQPDEVAEALEAGRALLHDSALAVKVRHSKSSHNIFTPSDENR